MAKYQQYTVFIHTNSIRNEKINTLFLSSRFISPGSAPSGSQSCDLKGLWTVHQRRTQGHGESYAEQARTPPSAAACLAAQSHILSSSQALASV